MVRVLVVSYYDHHSPGEVEEDVCDHEVSDEGGQVADDIGHQRGLGVDVPLEAQRVQEDRDGRGEGRADQDAVHAADIVLVGQVQEAQVVQEEAQVVLRPDVEALGEPGQVAAEVCDGGATRRREER